MEHVVLGRIRQTQQGKFAKSDVWVCQEGSIRNPFSHWSSASVKGHKPNDDIRFYTLRLRWWPCQQQRMYQPWWVLLWQQPHNENCKEITRIARFDILRATGALACNITKWDKNCDIMLNRVMGYLYHTRKYRLVAFVGDEIANVRPHIFAYTHNIVVPNKGWTTNHKWTHTQIHTHIYMHVCAHMDH